MRRKTRIFKGSWAVCICRKSSSSLLRSASSQTGTSHFHEVHQRKTYFEYIHIEPNWPLILGFDLPFLWVQSSKTRGPILGSTQYTNLFISPCQTAIYEKIPSVFWFWQFLDSNSHFCHKEEFNCHSPTVKCTNF